MNEGSGHQDTQARIDTVRGALRDDGREHLLLPVTAGGELPRALDRARAWAEAHDGALVAAGGDGTLNAVAQVAHGLGCPMGVLPHGTFNYFARSHGLPLDLDEGMRALLRAEPRPVQVGQVNGRVFLVNASLGLYPQIVPSRRASGATASTPGSRRCSPCCAGTARGGCAWSWPSGWSTSRRPRCSWATTGCSCSSWACRNRGWWARARWPP